MSPRPVVSSQPRRARGSACELGSGLWRWAWLEWVSRAPARTLGCLPPWICIQDVPAGCGAAPQPSPGVGSASPGSPKCRRRTLRCSPPCSSPGRRARETLMANKGFPGKRGCAGVPYRCLYRDPPSCLGAQKGQGTLGVTSLSTASRALPGLCPRQRLVWNLEPKLRMGPELPNPVTATDLGPRCPRLLSLLGASEL